MTSGAPATLIYAATGTGLSTILARLSGAHIVDLEREICSTYTGTKELALEDDEVPAMDLVARRPRSEIHARWVEVAARAANTLAKSDAASPRILAMHLSWYSPTTSEFFCPVMADPLLAGDFNRVVVLIDDVYDMVCRLEGPGDIYSEAAQRQRVKQLRGLGFNGTIDRDGVWEFSEEDSARAERHAWARAKHSALAHLLAWRRAEMIRAETLAQELGCDLQLFATKHSWRALELLLTDTTQKSIYLSHRITEPRGANRATANLPEDLGTWPSIVNEVNRLHFALVGRCVVDGPGSGDRRSQ